MFKSQNIKNALNCFFFKKNDFKPFYLVQLGMDNVQSPYVSCTFIPKSVQMPSRFSTNGLLICTLENPVQMPSIFAPLVHPIVLMASHIVQMDLSHVHLEEVS